MSSPVQQLIMGILPNAIAVVTVVMALLTAFLRSKSDDFVSIGLCSILAILTYAMLLAFISTFNPWHVPYWIYALLVTVIGFAAAATTYFTYSAEVSKNCVTALRSTYSDYTVTASFMPNITKDMHDALVAHLVQAGLYDAFAAKVRILASRVLIVPMYCSACAEREYSRYFRVSLSEFFKASGEEARRREAAAIYRRISQLYEMTVPPTPALIVPALLFSTFFWWIELFIPVSVWLAKKIADAYAFGIGKAREKASPHFPKI